jgi:proteasome lid subunit RPN8/RPN11
MIRQKKIETRRLPSRPERTWEPPALRFSPTAWAKLLFLRDAGESEVGAFGISAADDLLLIEDVELVRQVCTGVSVDFDDQAVADFFDRQVDAGRRPEQFARAWVHTHPGNSPQPSGLDEETFARVFGRTQWALIFILAAGGQSYARLRFHVGPGGDLELPVRVDYSRPFAASNQPVWQEEYLAAVEIADGFSGLGAPWRWDPLADPMDPSSEDWFSAWDRLLMEEEPVCADVEESCHAD